MVKLKSIEVYLNVPLLGGVKGTWVPSDDERLAAWELYIELVTRISVVKLETGQGILREALDSLYSLFATTRRVLRKHGPSVAVAKGKGDISLGELAIIILNYQLRPLLSEWHPRLQDYESKRGPEVSIGAHEDGWEHNSELRKRLDETREILIAYADLLAKAAKVPPLFKES